MLQEAGHRKNENLLVFCHIQCVHLMYAEVAWVLAFLRTQVGTQLQILLDADYLPDYLSVFYDYGSTSLCFLSWGDFYIVGAHIAAFFVFLHKLFCSPSLLSW